MDAVATWTTDGLIHPLGVKVLFIDGVSSFVEYAETAVGEVIGVVVGGYAYVIVVACGEGVFGFVYSAGGVG